MVIIIFVAGEAAKQNKRMWRNWQTRWIQVLVPLKECGFKSLHPHQRASSFGLRLFFFVLAFKLFIALPKAER